MNNVIEALTRVLEARRDADPERSYVASLYRDGLDKVLEKVGEEATEVLLAAKNLEQAGAGDSARRDALTGEVADLWFHTMVMMVQLNMSPQQVLDELEQRFGLSGLDEKAARGSQGNH
ncbi:MAG: phosphoribosyl-ATP diphosphatase [Pseudomonadota bacterium]